MSPELFAAHPVERVLYLETLPVFDGLSAPVVGALAAAAEERVLTAGPVKSGAEDACLYVVVEGLIEERFPNDAVVSTGAGGVAGLVSLLSADRSRIRAAEHSVVLALNWERQLVVAENHFELFTSYLGYLANLATDSLVRLPDGRVPPHPRDAVDGKALPIASDLVERTLALRASSDLPRASLDALFELARHVQTVEWNAGDVIWQVGSGADRFLELTTGTVRCAHAGGSFLVPAGRTLGMFDLLRGVNRWYEAVAHEPVTAMWIEEEAFLDILTDHPSSALEFAATIARRVVALAGAADRLRGS